MKVLFIALVLCCTVYAASNCNDLRSVATSGINALQNKFWSNNWFNDKWPGGSREHYWTYAMALDAVVDAVEDESKRGNWNRYNWMASTFGAISGQMSDWYDDEAWMAAVSARIYNLAKRRGDNNLANKARQNLEKLYNDIHAAWDTSCCGNLKTGVWWDRKHTQKATAANGGAIVVAMHMYNVTGNRGYIDFAWQVNNPWVSNMVQSDGNVCDHFDPKGTKTCGWLFTYNQGIMIGGAAMIAAANPGNPSQWNEAKRYVKFLLERETVSSQWGKVLNDGSNSGCAGDCKEFKAPTARYLRVFLDIGRRMFPQDKDLLDQVYDVLKGSAYAIANKAFNSRDGTFSTSWMGPAPQNNGPVFQNEQNAALQGLYAFLAVCK